MAKMTLNLPANFYKEEIRNDYVITSNMKKVWAVELDLFKQLDSICKKHNITYYADGGTLLGAIRHHGFIPWDDDMDFIMYRKDFEQLCKFSSEFKEPYFFQTEETDPGSLRCHAQLRNTSTTGILKSEMEYNYLFNQGIFIDIFPLDNVPQDLHERVDFVRKMKSLKLKARKYYNYNNGLERKIRITGVHTLLKNLKRPLFSFYYKNLNKKYKKTNPFYDKYIKEVVKYNKTNTKYVMDIAVGTENDLLCKDDIHSQIYIPFEMFEIPVPNNYSKVLESYYGNWHKMVRGKNAHGGCLFDVDKSYKEYLK